VKAMKTIGGVLFGHELLLTVLPFLKRFVKQNIKINSRNSQGVGAPGLPKIGASPRVVPTSVVPASTFTQVEGNRTSNHSGKGKKVFAALVGVTACVGIFVAINDGETGKNDPRNKWETLARSIVYIEGEDSVGNWSGSGTLIMDGSYILTNYHVAPGSGGAYSVYFTESFDRMPEEGYEAVFVVGDEFNDLAILQILDSAGEPLKIKGRTIVKPTSLRPTLSEELTIIGYPVIGFSEEKITMTITRGSYSGNFEDNESGEYFKTDGNISGGVSGGAAFNSRGDFIGIPSARNVDREQSSSIGLLKPANFAAGLISRVKP